MDTNKVFTGFDKDDNELLIYRETADLYFDLINNSELNKENIDLETLRYLRDTIRVLRYMPESIVKKIYTMDREKTVKSNEILLGFKGTIIDLKETTVQTGTNYLGMPFYNYYYNWKTTDIEYGIYTFFKKITIGKHHIYDNEYEYNLYKNWYDGKIYIGFNNAYTNINKLVTFNNGMEYVSIGKYTLENETKESIVEKRLVYEFANKVRKEEVK